MDTPHRLAINILNLITWHKYLSVKELQETSISYSNTGRCVSKYTFKYHNLLLWLLYILIHNVFIYFQVGDIPFMYLKCHLYKKIIWHDSLKISPKTTRCYHIDTLPYLRYGDWYISRRSCHNNHLTTACKALFPDDTMGETIFRQILSDLDWI